MKKIWLLTTLLMGWLLLSGCSFHVNINDTSSTDESNETTTYNLNNDAGRLLACNDRVGFYLNTETFNAEWDVEEEAWASFVLNWHVTREENWDVAEDDVECVIDMVDKSVNVEFSNHKFNGELQETEVVCGNIYNPLCWVDWKVYQNWCFLNVAWTHRDSTMWVKDNECIKLTKEALYWKYALIRYNDNHSVKDNYNVWLTISEDGIFAKFCNNLWASEYSLSRDMLDVKEMIQTEMACEWENWERLMRAESEFNLKNATVFLSENKLTISTSIWAQYEFEKQE